MNRIVAVLVALFAASVAFGAFGAHLLEDRLSPARLETYETALRYLWMQSASAVAVAAFDRATFVTVLPVWAAGTSIFVGSLLTLVATDIGVWGAVAPVGGVLMIAAWSWAAWLLWRNGSQRTRGVP